MHRVLLHHPHISAYSFCLLLGFLASFFLARWNAKRSGLPGRHVDNLTLLLIITGLTGARIFSWLFYFPSGIGFWRALYYPGGGLVFYGGVVFGVATVVLYALIARISLRRLIDVLAAPLALGLAFGRLGCFMAGCCWGDLCVDSNTIATLTSSERYRVQTVPALSSAHFPLAVQFPTDTGALEQHQRMNLLPSDAQRSLPVHPVQLYEAILAILLVVWLQRSTRINPGQTFWQFCLGYGIIRFLLEFLRADNSPDYLGLTISQVISLLAIAVCLPVALRRRPASATTKLPDPVPV